MTLPCLKTTSLAILAASLGLAACNGNDDDIQAPAAVATRTVTITPSLGRISNARVVLRNAARPTQILGDRLLNAAGTATFNIPTTVPNVVAELVPGPGTQYYDEGVPDNPATPAINESMQPFPVGQALRVAFSASGSSQNIGMTALTEAAYRRALALAGSDALNAAAISQANAYIQSVFGVGNILQAPVVIGSPDDYRRLLNAAAASRDYAMRLAALAQQARQNLPAGTEAPAIAMMNALAEDLRDGQLNSTGANVPYDFNAFLNAWRTAMTQLLTRIIGAIGSGEGGLTQAQVDSLTSLFNQLATNLQVNPNPGSGGGAAVPVRTVNGIAEYACSDEAKLKSTIAPSLNLDFVNNSGGALNIFWLDFSGNRQSYKTGLASGSTYPQSTFVTHPWLVTNAQGQCKGIYVATSAGNKSITFNGNGSVTLAGTVSTVTIPATLLGDYSLKFDMVNAGGPYTNGATVSASVRVNGDLVIGDKTLSNPFTRPENAGVLIWKDGDLEYALTNFSTGVFQAINLFDTAQAGKNYGQFAKVSTQNCSSNGADNLLGFTNAPSDLCSFAQSQASVNSIPALNKDIYTFTSNAGETVMVTVDSGVVVGVSVEKGSQYGFACGAGIATHCANINFSGNAGSKSFTFNNTQLEGVTGSNQPLTIKNGSLNFTVPSGGGGAVAVDLSKCAHPAVQVQTAFGKTASQYNQCQSDSIADFSLTGLDTNNFRPGFDGVSCQVVKTGSTITVTKGARSMSVQLDAELTDNIVEVTGTLSDTDKQYEFNVTDNLGVGRVMGVKIAKNGVVQSVVMHDTPTNTTLTCLN